MKSALAVSFVKCIYILPTKRWIARSYRICVRRKLH